MSDYLWMAGNLFVVCVVIVAVIGVALGIQRGNVEYRNVTENCIKTEMFVFGNKGHRTRVYDCTGVDI